MAIPRVSPILVHETNTLNGTKVVIYSTEAGGIYPIHGAYFSGDRWIPTAWTAEGRKFEGCESRLDLMEVLEPKK